MTVFELISILQQFPPDYKVYCEGGDYKDDYREVYKVEVSHRSTLGTPVGIFIKNE
jgi:hypothetical protein